MEQQIFITLLSIRVLTKLICWKLIQKMTIIFNSMAPIMLVDGQEEYIPAKTRRLGKHYGLKMEP